LEQLEYTPDIHLMQSIKQYCAT